MNAHGRRQCGLSLVAWLVLLAACDQGDLQRKLAQESLGRDAIEFYLPEDANGLLGEAIVAELAKRQADLLRIELPALEGSFGDPLTFATEQAMVELPVTSVRCIPQEGRVLVSIALDQVEANVPVDVYSGEQVLTTCFLHLVIPSRQVQGVLIWDNDTDDLPVVAVEGPAELEGEPVSMSLPADCPEQPGSGFEAMMGPAFQEAQAVGANQLVAMAAEALGSAAGLEAGGGVSLPSAEADGMLHVEFGCLPTAVSAGDDVTVRLTGGVESTRAACVPPDAPVPGPGLEPPAVFDQRVPRTGESYTLGVSLSRGLLLQGLAAAYRAGWFCRRTSAGTLTGVSLEGLLPSLESIGTPRGVRLALWPVSSPVLELDGPYLDAGERLPRLVLSFERLDVDVYTGLDGADLRVLGLSASVSLTLVPYLDGQALGLQLARVEIDDLEVTYAELPAESDTVLRSAAATLLEQAAAALVGDIQPVLLERPAAGRGELLGSRLTDDRVLLYFRP